MGYGDEIMASGMAKGAKARGKRIAFGDGRQIVWSTQSYEIFQNNPNIAPPGSERAGDLEWIAHYRGHRLYATYFNGVWSFNPKFHPIAGDLYFTDEEVEAGRKMMPAGAIVVEPHVKPSVPNKLWPVDRMRDLVWRLTKSGHQVVQFDYGRPIMEGARPIPTGGLVRISLAALANAELYVGPEGMMHHASAALGKPAVVIFGGFISPTVTGYATHTNLVGTDKACGRSAPCQHCRQSMDKITVDDVLGAVNNIVARRNF